MKNYLRAVSLTLGISIVLIFGTINAIFMTPNTEWFVTLIKPKLSENVHSFLWLICYMLISVIIAEFFIVQKLQKRIWSVALILIGNALWCYSFFRMQNIVVSLAIIIAILSATIYVLYLSIKHTRYLCLFVLPVVVWYIVLTGLNILILVLNA